MAIIWDILDSIRQKLIEELDLRTVVIGDGDIAASLLPAAQIRPRTVISNSAAGVPIVIEVTPRIEFFFLPKTEKQVISGQIHKAVEVLNTDIYPDGCRISGSPRAKIDYPKNLAVMELTIRWVERE